MATIHFAESPHPAHEYRSPTDGGDDRATHLARKTSRVSTHYDDGIVHMRSRAATNLHRTKTGEIQDEDPGIRNSGDYKERQVFRGKTLILLAYQSIGVIYGDIGTSPLYVYSSTFTEAPSRQDLVGVLSIVIWSLIMMVTIKYILVILRMDNDGEGGTFSTYSLLSRYLNITNRDPREASLVQMKRYMTDDLEASGRAMRKGIESSKFVKTLLKVMGVLAVSMVMSDGVLTPAQSVLGAVQGIEVVDPTLSKGVIIGVTDAILVLLFLIQPFGVGKLSFAFAPIIVIWLAFNAVFGIYNLSKYDWTVLAAFNPGFAFEYLIRHGEKGWRSLGGILLAFTGVEALFADLGAFSRRAIQLSWLCYAFPCILLAYIGQASYISRFPEAYNNPFFNCAPPGTIYPSLIIAILAAIVASQAIITATFQLIAQITKLSYCPQIQVVHTSKTHHGQLYVPIVNWLLLLGTVLVASIYNNTTSLGNAYGVCVIFVTFMDSCMVALGAIFVWRIPPYVVVWPWLVIACLDGTYLSSALTKVPDGAWFTLMLSAILAAAFILWRFGKESQWNSEAEDRFPTSHFVRTRSDGQLSLVDRYGGIEMSSIKGFGLFFDKAGETTPIVFSQFAIKLIAAPEVMVFFHLRPLERPSVPIEERYVVSRLAIPHCYRVVVRHGYMDEIINPNLAFTVYEVVRDYLVQQNEDHVPIVPAALSISSAVDRPSAVGIDETVAGAATTTTTTTMTTQEQTNEKGSATATTTDKTNDNNNNNNNNNTPQRIITSTTTALQKLDDAYAHQVLYVLGKVQLKIKPDTNIFRKTLLGIFLWVRENTRNKIANLKVPTERVVEVGFVKDI